MKYFFITALAAGLLFSCDQNNRDNDNKSDVKEGDSVESYDTSNQVEVEVDENGQTIGDAVRGAGKDVKEAGKDVGDAVGGAASDVKDVFDGQTPAEEAAEDKREGDR